MALEAKLYKREGSWVFYVEDWDDDLDSPVDEHWTECVEWTVEQLEGQPRVKRMAYDMWYFERKREAEKFKTFWLLKWSNPDLS